MRLFKSIDEKFNEIGFIKTDENEYGIYYERKDEKYNYIHALDLLHKQNGRHIIQSYQKNSVGEFSNMVGLTPYEAKLAVKKMGQKGWR